MKLIQLTCNCCGAQLDVDLDNMQAVCPYCGQKLMFDTGQMETLLAEREVTKREQEKTKQEQLKYEHKERKEARNDASFFKSMIFIMLIGVIFSGLIFFMNERGKSEHLANNEIQITDSASDLRGKNYEDVDTLLKSAGFANIELVKDEDLVLGIISKDGTVESVSINGDTEFSTSDWFPKDAAVRITYHTFKNG